MTELRPFEIIAEGLGFPEGPVAMGDGSVIVMEVVARRISRCWDGKRETICETDGAPNGAAIGPDGALYVCNNGGLDIENFHSSTGPGSEGRIERVDLATGKIERVYDSCDGFPLSAPNDLVIAADGTIYFSDLGKTYGRSRDASGLYAGAADGSSIKCLHYRATSYNGVGLSPDGRTVYAADTFESRLYAFAVGVDNPERKLVANVAGDLVLDSLAVTAAGNICVGANFFGGIATITPEGQVSLEKFDDRLVTNIAFGGADMQDAVIALSESGRLARVRWDEPGLRLAFNA